MNSRTGDDLETPDVSRDLATSVYRQLRESIVSLRVAPGTPLTEIDLCERLGVSRTPVRAALQRLQKERFVCASKHGKNNRLRVSPLTAEDMRELFLMVGALDGVAAWLAAQLPDEVRSRVIERMTAVNRELRDLSGRKELSDIRVAQGLDGQFHRAYQEAAAGPQLLNELDALHARRERYVRIYTEALVHGHHLEDSLREHEAILSALQAGDAAQAETHAVFNHRNALDRYHRIIDAFGERGSW